MLFARRLLLNCALLLRYSDATFTALAPYGESVVVQGNTAVAKWEGAQGAAWRNVTITLMTGNNVEMTPMGVIAENIDATSTTSHTFSVPEVEPNSPIYFLQFTACDNDKPSEYGWTSRFCISDDKGSKPGKPEHDEQPDGKKTPWGNGHMRGHDNPEPTPHKESQTPKAPPPVTDKPRKPHNSEPVPPAPSVPVPPPVVPTQPPQIITYTVPGIPVTSVMTTTTSKEAPRPPPPVTSTRTKETTQPPVVSIKTKEVAQPPVVSTITQDAPPPSVITKTQEPPPPVPSKSTVVVENPPPETAPCTTSTPPAVVTRTECPCDDELKTTAIAGIPPTPTEPGAPALNPSGGSKIPATPAGSPPTHSSAGSKKPAIQATTTGASLSACALPSYTTTCSVLTATLTGRETALGMDCSTLAVSGNVDAACSAGFGTGQAQTVPLTTKLNDLANTTSTALAGQADAGLASRRTDLRADFLPLVAAIAAVVAVRL